MPVGGVDFVMDSMDFSLPITSNCVESAVILQAYLSLIILRLSLILSLNFTYVKEV